MSLLDGKKRQPDQIVIVERVRDYKNESMADSIMNDREGMRIASDITNAINRKKALKMRDKRNQLLRNVNPYIEELADEESQNVGDTIGNLQEARLFECISTLCQMDMDIYKRNEFCGNVNEKIERAVAEFPYDNPSISKKVFAANKIIAMCKADMAKKGFGALKGAVSGLLKK